MLNTALRTPMAETKDRRQTGVRFPPEMRVKLGYVALERGLSLNDLIIKGMSEWYNGQPEAKKHGPLPSFEPTKRGVKPKEDDE